MATDTKTKLDDILWLEEGINHITSGGQDPVLGLLSCLELVDDHLYQSTLFDIEKIIRAKIDQLPPEQQQLFRSKLVELEPCVQCELMTATSFTPATRNMKWRGRYTHGFAIKNWIFWNTTRNDDFVTLHCFYSLNERSTTPEVFQKTNKFEYMSCGTLGMFDHTFSNAVTTELKTVQDFCETHQCTVFLANVVT